jgi:hypothetical protein
MKRIASCGVALFGWAFFAAVSQAQYQSPAYSPYLNLLRSGNPAYNYYGLVRPQIATANAFQALGNNQYSQNVGPSMNANQPLQTGNRSTFMTHTRFFLNQGGGRGTVGNNPIARPGAGNQPGGQQGIPPLSAFGR